MTIAQARELKPGDTVTWNDPDHGICSHTGPLLYIDIPPFDPDEGDDVIIALAFENGGEVECFAHELSKRPDEISFRHLDG